ncbi:MAG TPA: spermidine/putrescine ABC transporter substrate-binding protein [Thermoanaerobaculia bacterium]|nr:spermidine/putrescine ABC transporter substrate-binding protein [Thermoanaerobaculia bacterium]
MRRLGGSGHPRCATLRVFAGFAALAAPAAAGALLAAALAGGCGRTPPGSPPGSPPGAPTGSPPAAARAGAGSVARGRQGKLNVYFWTNYLPEDVVAEFERRTGLEVTVDTYSANEALLAKLQSGVADYDVVVPSDYLLKVLIPQRLLRELDHARLPHLPNLDPRFLAQQFDPANRYSLPYLWGTTGLGYDKRKVAAPIDSWSAVFDARYAGRILMLDDEREVFAAALKLAGRSLNERDPAALRQAAARLAAQKSLVRTYNSSDFANLLAAGDVDIAQGYNGELAKVVARQPERLAYVVPKEGGTLWIDNLAVPRTARHLDAAYRFLDYLLEAEVAARVVDGVRYASANRAAFRLIDAAIRNDPAIYPPPAVLGRCELMEDLGATTPLLDQLWTEIKSQ